MDFYQVGDSIECQKSEIIAKKIGKGYLKYHPKIGKAFMYYKCERSGTAEIIEELNPKRPIVSDHSGLDQGDKLNGDKLEIYIDIKKRLRSEHIGGHTGKHGSCRFKSDKFTYARISKQYDTVPAEIDKPKRIDE